MPVSEGRSITLPAEPASVKRAIAGAGFGGLRYVTGFPDRPPARANLSLGDTIAGIHTAMGILAAVYHRDVKRTGAGQVVAACTVE